MEEKALQMVREYILKHMDRSDGEKEFTLFVVWKCHILQNEKMLISSTLPDWAYYELTYNGDQDEWYMDVYKKVENKVVRG